MTKRPSKTPSGGQGSGLDDHTKEAGRPKSKKTAEKTDKAKAAEEEAKTEDAKAGKSDLTEAEKTKAAAADEMRDAFSGSCVRRRARRATAPSTRVAAKPKQNTPSDKP